LVDARNTAIKTEDDRQKIFDATVAEYNGILKKLADTEGRLTQYQSDMKACLVQE